MTCPECTEARARAWWGGYRANCNGCTARAIARSLDAFNALAASGTGDKDALRALIGRLMPNVEPAQARRMVWEWWTQDHPQQPPTT